MAAQGSSAAARTGVGKVRRRRPGRVRQLRHALRRVGEPVDTPVELLQHPRARVALLHVLDVHDPCQASAKDGPATRR
eukprot:1059179-Prymnesium_polylepis.1